MDEAALARAADLFFTTKGLGKGTGLGLSMVHGFAVQSGGALLLSSQLGVGTVVEIWLPRATAVAGGKDARRASTVVASKHRGRPLRILLVDDDLLVVANATAMLEELGHEVSSATSGADALTQSARSFRSYADGLHDAWHVGRAVGCPGAGALSVSANSARQWIR
jgi:hypothetical protein